MSWEGVGNIHYTKLRSLQDPRPHGKPNAEDEAAHENPTTSNGSKAWEVIKTHDATQPQIPFDKNNRSIRERLFEQAQRYQPPFNKGNPIWNIQCESFARCDTFTQCETFLSVTPLLSVKLLLSVTPSLSVKLLLSVTPSLSVKLLLSVKFLLHGKISFQYTTGQWARP